MNGNQELRSILSVGLVVVLALVLLPALVMIFMMGGGMIVGGMMGGWNSTLGNSGNWWWGGLVMLVMLVLLIGGIAAVIAWTLRRGGQAFRPDNDEALSILKQRYARGEIDKEQYEQIRRDLTPV